MKSALLLLLFAAAPAAAQEKAPLLTEEETRAIAAEVSGARAKRTVEALSLHHRMRGSDGYNAAAALLAGRAREYGLSGVETIRLKADGELFYGTQRSRPAWNARFAELWEQRRESGGWRDAVRIASFAERPISLAQDSVSGRAEAELVDIGAGTAPADYEGEDLRGKLVLTSSQPEAVARAAVTERGAAGIVSWAQNQRSAWWGEDESLVRWGHLSTWEDPTFAFMVSPAQARAWQARLAKGETVRLRAEVEAERSAGEYLIPTAVIPGAEPDREIVLSCHLDHPSPGANDNASGCAGILEVARSLNRLVAEGKLPQPARTIRFVWPCEIECTIALLAARPEYAKRTLATIHLDMIGGNTDVTKSTLQVEGSPPSLPSFASDVGFAVARWVDAQATRYADTGAADFPLLEGEGTKNPLRAKIGGFSEGSDHQVWAEGSWRIPVIYVSDWPDIYIHTDKDVPANLDATKMKRALFIAAASAWVLANIGDGDSAAAQDAMAAEQAMRVAEAYRRTPVMGAEEEANLVRHVGAHHAEVVQSLARFGMWQSAHAIAAADAAAASGPSRPKPEGEAGFVYRRNPKLKGPMNGFGYSWLDDQLTQAGLPRPALLSRTPRREGASYGYEALNLVDGERSVADIAADLAATLGSVPIDEVAAYLVTLERLGALERR